MHLRFDTNISWHPYWPAYRWFHWLPHCHGGWDASHGSYSFGFVLGRFALWFTVTPWGVYKWTHHLDENVKR